MKILIVDDNLINLRLIKLMIQSFIVADIVCATDAEKALKSIAQEKPEVILMDIALPGMDGLTLTRQLKADPSTRDIRIIAITSYAMMGDKEKTIEAGCDNYIAKPIDKKDLINKINGK